MSQDCCSKEPGIAPPEDCCDEKLVAQLKALGHPVRMQIVRQLLGGDERCCGDFCACMPLAQSTISQHLDLLCKAGLVRLEPRGTRSLYSIDQSAFAALAGAMGVVAQQAASGQLPQEIPAGTTT